MSFNYPKRSIEELEQIAEIVFSRYAHRCTGFYIDVEGILEDCGLTILPRSGGLHKLVEGYVANDPHYIILSEQGYYPPRYRPVVAEELCHAILEYDFLTQGKLPIDAQPHNLTKEQHQVIESDAKYLARAVLMPRDKFKTQFEAHWKNAPSDAAWKHGLHLRYCAEQLESDFQVWYRVVADRATDLNLISEQDRKEHFSGKIVM